MGETPTSSFVDIENDYVCCGKLNQRSIFLWIKNILNSGQLFGPIKFLERLILKSQSVMHFVVCKLFLEI